MQLRVYKNIDEDEIRNKLLTFKINMKEGDPRLQKSPSLNGKNLFYAVDDSDDLQVVFDGNTTFYTDDFILWAQKNKIEVIHNCRGDYLTVVTSPDPDLSLYLAYVDMGMDEDQLEPLVNMEVFNQFKAKDEMELRRRLHEQLNASLHLYANFIE